MKTSRCLFAVSSSRMLNAYREMSLLARTPLNNDTFETLLDQGRDSSGTQSHTPFAGRTLARNTCGPKYGTRRVCNQRGPLRFFSVLEANS